MEQVKMLTLFGKEPKKMNRTEIRRELKAQKALLRTVKRTKKIAEYKHEQKGFDLEANQRELESVKSQYASHLIDITEYRRRTRTLNTSIGHAVAREDAIAFYGIVIKNLEALIAELEFYKDRRQEAPKEESAAMRFVRRQQYRENEKRLRNDTYKVWAYTKQMEREGIGVSWDREKFFQVANDRGYQTESSVIHAVDEELRVGRAKAEAMMRRGKFTWGQVLCLGALMQMTPKEFCNVFLSGYFEDMFGEYRASYANIDKDALLHAMTYLPSEETQESESEQDFALLT